MTRQVGRGSRNRSHRHERARSSSRPGYKHQHRATTNLRERPGKGQTSPPDAATCVKRHRGRREGMIMYQGRVPSVSESHQKAGSQSNCRGGRTAVNRPANSDVLLADKSASSPVIYLLALSERVIVGSHSYLIKLKTKALRGNSGWLNCDQV